MDFKSANLKLLMAAPPADAQSAAERANLCLEERVSDARRAVYEPRMEAVGAWDDWRGDHERYVLEQVRRRDPLSVAFAAGEPSLRSGIEGNEWLLRLERIDKVLKTYTDEKGAFSVDAINGWIGVQGKPKPPKGTSLKELGTLYYGTADNSESSALDDLTGFLNQLRADSRPAFVAFDAEFPGLLERPDWMEHFCRGCGLAHHFVGSPVTLALMRYQVREVTDFHPRHTTTVFAVPTVLDQPFYNVFCPAPVGADWGHAAALDEGGGELVAEVIHARIDYQPRHWVRVGVMLGNRFADQVINGLRERHLDRLRSRSGRPDFGSHC